MSIEPIAPELIQSWSAGNSPTNGELAKSFEAALKMEGWRLDPMSVTTPPQPGQEQGTGDAYHPPLPLPEGDETGLGPIVRPMPLPLEEEAGSSSPWQAAPEDGDEIGLGPITRPMPLPIDEESGLGPIAKPMPLPVESDGPGNNTAAPTETGGGLGEAAPMSALTEMLGDAGAADGSGSILAGLMAMAGGGDWTYNRENLMSEVDTLLTAMGVDHHDRLELTEMFPPEGAQLDLVRMGRLVTKAGDILAGRVDAGKLAQLLPESGMSEGEVQSWLTSVGVEYQRTGELMKADGESGGAFNSILVEENLVTNLVTTLPDKLEISDLAGLITNTVGEAALHSAFGALLGDLLS